MTINSFWVESVDFHDQYELSRLQFVSHGCAAKTSKIGIDVLTLTSFSGWLNVSQNNKTGSTLSGEIPAILLVHTTVLCGPLYVSCSVSSSRQRSGNEVDVHGMV